jgi:hypothetical protein
VRLTLWNDLEHVDAGDRAAVAVNVIVSPGDRRAQEAATLAAQSRHADSGRDGRVTLFVATRSRQDGRLQRRKRASAPHTLMSLRLPSALATGRIGTWRAVARELDRGGAAHWCGNPGQGGSVQLDHMSIGEFAKRSRLSPKALRLYDELALLTPARVDDGSGYRYYTRSQLDRARLIAALRQLQIRSPRSSRSSS